MEAKSIELSGIRMRWLEHGEGLPVILVHGIPTSPALWRKVIPLVRNARILAWEMPGYGDSIPEGQGRDISVAKQADYLRSFMDALGIGRAVLVGHDLGGGVVQILALGERERCAGIVLVNAIGYDSWPVPPIVMTQKLGSLAEHLPNKLFQLNFTTLLALGYQDRNVGRESGELHFDKYAAHGGASGFVRQARALRTRDTLAVQDRLKELRGLPARVVWGAADPYQKLRYGRRFAADLDCKLISIPGGRHFVPEDQPEVVADAISEVVQEALARRDEPART